MSIMMCEKLGKRLEAAHGDEKEYDDSAVGHNQGGRTERAILEMECETELFCPHQ